MATQTEVTPAVNKGFVQGWLDGLSLAESHY